MKADVVPTLNELKMEKLLGRTIVVIDVLRSTTTIISAFNRGCQEIIPVETCGQAYSLMDANTYLVGERYCKKIQGFDFSNSPSELIQQNLAGKRIVLSTTNGTGAILKAKKGSTVLLGAFLNGSAVAEELYRLKRDLTLLCAGTRNEFALEDFLCAGFILSQLSVRDSTVELGDYALAAKAAYLQLQHEIEKIMSTTTTGRRLAQMGLHDDLFYSAQLDQSDLVPYLKEESIIVRSYS